MHYEVDSYKLEYIEDTNKYYISFKDSVGIPCKLEITKDIFEAYMVSKKEYTKIKNQYDRHEEHSELKEVTLYKRAIKKDEELLDKIINEINIKKLKKAKEELTKTQRTRIELHIEDGITIRDLAKKQGVRKKQIEKSIFLGLKKLKKFFQN